LIESILLPELHRHIPAKNSYGGLDLALRGPDGNSRAFELFWRTAGEPEKLVITPERTQLLAARRLLVEAAPPEGYNFSRLFLDLEDAGYAGKVDIEVFKQGNWNPVGIGVAIRGGITSDFYLPHADFERIRLYFSGYDRNFNEVPVFVSKIEVEGRKSGLDYHRSSITPAFEQKTIDGGIELRILLPGSGIVIKNFTIATAAQFKGKWQLGTERIVLGRRDFELFSQGEIGAVGPERQKFSIDYEKAWPGRVVLIRLTSEDYFGLVEDVKALVLLPRILFVADQPGSYFALTGSGKNAKINEQPATQAKNTDQALQFKAAAENPAWQTESLLKDYSARGAPFNEEGFLWRTAFNVDNPGLIQLETEATVNLDRSRSSLRIVREGFQIPYFLGREELREIAVDVEASYESLNNRSVYLIRLPKDAARLASIKFKARGIFDRQLILEKHAPGQISWQTWQNRRWVNERDKESVFTLALYDFPEDQSELRMIVEHGSNQPLEIQGFVGYYNAQDLFFVAAEKGAYYLYGGNNAVRSPVYDLAIIQEQLLELMPAKVRHGSVEKTVTAPGTDKTADQGGPFNESGYSWVASFAVAAPGFYQLELNRKAALDNNRHGIRLVQDGIQIPYFWGNTREKTIELELANQYDKKSNSSIYSFALLVVSRNWRSLRFKAGGVFVRTPVLEIPKPGKLGWQAFKKQDWTNRSEDTAVLEISLDRLPEGERQFRLVIAHGDNSPVELTGVSAVYHVQDLLFSAAAAGEYRVYGGNSKVGAPVYDMSLVKDRLLKSEPEKIVLGEAADFSSSSDIKKHLEETFSETGWGLYLVLGLVTLLLIVMIVRLFPEEPPKDKPAE
jgi:hypothetical protein